MCEFEHDWNDISLFNNKEIKTMIKIINTKGKGRKMIAYYIKRGFAIANYNHNVFTLIKGI